MAVILVCENLLVLVTMNKAFIMLDKASIMEHPVLRSVDNNIQVLEINSELPCFHGHLESSARS